MNQRQFTQICGTAIHTELPLSTADYRIPTFERPDTLRNLSALLHADTFAIDQALVRDCGPPETELYDDPDLFG